MNAKALFTGFFVLAGSLGVISPAFSQQSPPESEKAKKIVAVVDKAATLIDAKGKSVFAEFRKPGSDWFNGDRDLFVDYYKGKILFNGGSPEVEGNDVSGLKDSNGKLFVVEMEKLTHAQGSGWVDYMWPKPGQSQPSQKWTYVKAVKIDGVPGYVGAGFYP